MIVVTLVCCYVACWGPTKTKGVNDVNRDMHTRVSDYPNLHDGTSSSIPWNFSPLVPLVVGVNYKSKRAYFFWFFGFVAKLPYEREVGPVVPVQTWRPTTQRPLTKHPTIPDPMADDTVQGPGHESVE